MKKLRRKPLPMARIPVVHCDRIAKSYGVCSHPNFNTTVYQHTEAWFDCLSQVGARSFRGLCAPTLASVKLTAQLARARNMKWLATVTPADWSQTSGELVTRLVQIRDNYADVIFAIEGVNEPNASRTSTPPPKDWAERTVATQKTIYEFVQANPSMSHITVVGPSLHATIDSAHADHQRLGALGLAKYMDVAGLHRYFGGRYPDYVVDERIGWIHEAYGDDMGVWVTETGYTNSVANLTQHRPVPEEVSAQYGPLTLLEFFSRGCNMMRYELLDDPDTGPKDVVESNFGLFRTPTMDPKTWTPKPEVAIMRDFLDHLSDPGPEFTPKKLQVEVEAPPNVKWLPVGNRAGKRWLLLWTTDPIFDPGTQKHLPATTTTATIKRPRRQWNVEITNGAARAVPIGER